MRHFVAIGAILLAGAASSAAQGVTFDNLPGTVTYTSVKSIGEDGSCGWGDPVTNTNPVAPLDEGFSFIIRGPATLSKFAVYNLDDSKAKRSLHLHKHKRRAHADFHQAQKEKREAEAEPIYGQTVTAVIDGKKVEMVDTWSPKDSAAGAAPAPAAAAAPAGPAPKAAPKYDAGPGHYARSAWYDAKNKADAYGLTFQANDKWSAESYKGLGAVLGHVSADGKSYSASSQVLDECEIEDGKEIIISSDKPCDGHPLCGTVAPGADAYRGFEGVNKVIAFEWLAPYSGKKSADIYTPADMSATWLLNTKIVNAGQYRDCSCWKPGCGEFDIHEVLTPGNDTGFSTMHMGDNYSGMAPQGFRRPADAPMKMAVIITDRVAHVQVLDDATVFKPVLDAGTVDAWLNQGKGTSGANSLFPVIRGAVPQPNFGKK